MTLTANLTAKPTAGMWHADPPGLVMRDQVKECG
jgi:hypothetical protein